MGIAVWSERQKTGWTDCVFSAYAMALEYGGFSAFPSGVNTDAERDAFAGPYDNKKTGSTLAQADTRSLARYGTKLSVLSGSLTNALTRPGYALVVTGNYNRLDPNSSLVRDVYTWNNYDKSKPLPSVDHAVTIITGADGKLTWLDPTAKNGSAGVPVSAADVLAFNGGNLSKYPVRMVQQNALAPATKPAASVASYLGIDPTTPFTADIVTKAISKYENDNGLTGMAASYANNNLLALFQHWLDKSGTTAGDVPFNVDTSGHNTSDVLIPTPEQQASGDTTRATNFIPDPMQGLADAAGSLVTFLGKLTNPANWLHIGAMFAGVGLVGFGLVMVARDVSGGGSVQTVSPTPIIVKEGA